jgi:hypothetical protein
MIQVFFSMDGGKEKGKEWTSCCCGEPGREIRKPLKAC